MLRITVELWPGGHEQRRRTIATASIGRVHDGAFADYQATLSEELLGEVGDVALVRGYPRWSASVWDLVARGIAVALNNGAEVLPARPTLPVVQVHVSGDGVRYVWLGEIPEPAGTFFRHRLYGSTDPQPGCAYPHDREHFLGGGR
ncbi:hypothetical protein LJ655_08920 [Paraburkholderia sp. MMS20-SJTN17]|uniref:Uncharacterized protein n=1 Tax=Paraburkholderia translucens TaxID=2886945 RepID=A0ABS8KBB6_9BURK|nr:hypothetical protein [Paraburkholderia sp. MMS20-SJTN17]